MNKTTGLEGSGKFQEKLTLKQKQIEAQMLENRLRKLHNEEVRLQKQIRIANKHSEFADQVKQRRDDDNAMMNWHKQNQMENEMRQRELNNARREANKQSIASHKNTVLSNNAESRNHLKQVTNKLLSDKAQMKFEHLTERQAARDFSLSKKIDAGNNSRFNRQAYNESVTQAHIQRADEAARLREANEMRIKHLEEIEQRMVQDLQRTLQQKNNAISDLANKSKGLKKVMQPRMAYKYAPRENSTSELLNMAATSQYAFSGRKGSNVANDSAVNLYNRRAQSINNGQVPGAAPSSGQGIMLNDTSDKNFKQSNEVVFVGDQSTPKPTEGEAC